MSRLALSVLVCVCAAPVAAQSTAWSHPCPAAVDTTDGALAGSTEPRFDSADPGQPIYFRRILQVELVDSVGPDGLCRILEAAEAVGLTAWQPQSAVHVLIRLREMPRSADELEERRRAVLEIPGVRRVAKTMVPRLYWR
jgi:hypothetical protein